MSEIDNVLADSCTFSDYDSDAYITFEMCASELNF
jgi:hypothetical protein